MSGLPLLALVSEEASHSSGNAPAEILLVALMLLIAWGAMRVTGRKRH
jgi:hypothetical protein